MQNEIARKANTVTMVGREEDDSEKTFTWKRVLHKVGRQWEREFGHKKYDISEVMEMEDIKREATKELQEIQELDEE